MPSLDKYTGTWNSSKANHLLRRATFGAAKNSVHEAVSLGLEGTIDKLFSINIPEPPLKYELDGTGRNEVDDPGVSYGQTWVNAPALPDLPQNQRNKAINARKRSLYAWTFLNMQKEGISILEKMTLFWHNHFVAVNNNPHREYIYSKTLRENALGNAKELTKLITIDTNMLLYLSGFQNSNHAPNENYSRELLELFTVGKGQAVGNGDYSNYTEDDVVEIAKVLTGWRVRGLANPDALTSYFVDRRHTKGDKILSHRFGEAVISENGDQEYKDLIDKIFEQDECSRFIVRQLYRWFVNSELTNQIEQDIIEPLAKIVRENDYEVAPALRVLLASEHFFQQTFCMVKSPIDLLTSVTTSLNFKLENSTIKEEYDVAYFLFQACADLNQAIFNHPDVAGWKAYYQEPLFYKSWINTFLLPKRLEYCKILVTGGDIKVGNRRFQIPKLIPVLSLAEDIDNAHDPNILVSQLANHLFSYELSNNQLQSLKEILIPGLPDFEWTIEYNDYLDKPEDTSKRLSVDNKLRSLVATMVQMSEFQIM